jgi:hypothetical protein
MFSGLSRLDEMRSVGARTTGGALLSAVRLVRSETPVDRQTRKSTSGREGGKSVGFALYVFLA